MSRKHIWYFLRDLEGRPIANAALRLRLADTGDDAVIYSIPVSGSGDEIDQSTWSTNASGFIEFFLGDFAEDLPKVGYQADQLFDLRWVSTGSVAASGILQDRAFFPLLFPVDETDPVDTDSDKMISNQLAYKLEEHIPLLQEVTQVHGLEPVDPNDPSDASYNKLISDDLMRVLLQDLNTLLTCGGEAVSIDTSGALIDQLSVTSWTLSANGTYYANFPHVLDRVNMYPIIQFYDTQSREQIVPVAVKDINTSVIRAWIADDSIDVTATICGQVI